MKKQATTAIVNDKIKTLKTNKNKKLYELLDKNQVKLKAIQTEGWMDSQKK